MDRRRYVLGVAGAAALLMCSAATAQPGGGATLGRALPPLLAGLQAQLAQFRYCADEITDAGADWWDFWWGLPERGCGDCEDFAAFSFARLREAGVPMRDIRLRAADLGTRRLADGKPARVLHVWLEVEYGDTTWTIWNNQIRPGTQRRTGMLQPEQVRSLVEDRFGPNWPYGVDIE